MAEDMWHDPVLYQGKVLSTAGEAARERDVMQNSPLPHQLPGIPVPTGKLL